MASKSKRRRKVLGASCILAALIIAGSSFAWFTSKDEVINRLSAQADYGVSIVESFAPPANWLPGQEVNKDVYAVNTGNVDAFVEETVSGVLTITTEKAVAGTTPTAKSIKLNAAERYVVEAGSYLAWAPDASNHEQGEKVVAMVPDSTDLTNYTTADATTDFTPDAAGLYVFRRSIGVNDDKSETFKYDGYYFDGKDYYKISDLKVTPDGASYAGDGISTDGNLTSASYGFYEEETKAAQPTALTYDSENKRLVATYNTGSAASDLATLATNYDNALVAYEEALEEYQAALRGNTTADETVTTKNNALQTALNNLLAAQKTLKEKQDALADANKAKTNADNAKVAAQKAVDDAKVALYGNKDGGTTGLTTTDGGEANKYTANSLYGKYQTAMTNDNNAQTDIDNAKVTLYGHKDGSTAESTGNTVGEANKYTTNSVYGEWKAAYEAKELASTSDARDAFINYLVTNDTAPLNAITSSTQAEAWLDTVSYDVLNGLGITNTQVGYNYYQLCVAEKQKKEDLNAAENTLTQKESAKDQTTQRLIDAKKAVDDAMVALYGKNDGGESDKTTVSGGETGKYTADSTYGKLKQAEEDVTTAEGNVTAAQGQVDTAMTTLYGYKDGGVDNEGDSQTEGTDSVGYYKTTSVYGKYVKAQNEYDSAVAAAGDPGASGNLTTARNNLASKTQALSEAQEAYENASNDTNPSANELRIFINLSDDVVTTTGTADKWQMLPVANNDTTAYFYYTSILGAGETTTKLIDSVELDENTTQDMFKSFDFDLNVALKSAQIAYDADGNITTDAAASELDANATVATPTSVDSVVNWTLK